VEAPQTTPNVKNRNQKDESAMDQATHNKIVSFIWGIADDVLRDLFKRGKYPDVILPMCVLRRMDAVLEPTKKAVVETKKMLDDARITEQRAALCDAASQAFYNTSKFTLRDLKSRGSQQQLLADFEDYLNGFSPNVQDILDNFKFRNQLKGEWLRHHSFERGRIGPVGDDQILAVDKPVRSRRKSWARQGHGKGPLAHLVELHRARSLGSVSSSRVRSSTFTPSSGRARFLDD
jgi:hypothetical protein